MEPQSDNKAKRRNRGIPTDGDAVTKAMEQKQLRVAALAEKSGVSASSIKAAREGRSVDSSTIDKLAKALDREPSDLQADSSESDAGEVPTIPDFVGREKFVQAVRHFEERRDSGVLFLEGEPGIGKTWLVRHLSIEVEALGSYFISSTTGRNSPERVVQGVKNQVKAQRSVTIGKQDTLIDLLKSIDMKDLENSAWLLFDALDELEESGASRGQNPFLLPPVLPKGIFVLMSMRPGTPCGTFNDVQVLKIDPSAQENLDDVKSFISKEVKRKGVAAWQKRSKLSDSDLVASLLDRSCGNFMYARQVLDAIGRGELDHLDSNSLPMGLLGYYEVQWQRMQNSLGGRVEEIDRKVILCLARQRHPMSIPELATLLNIDPVKLGGIINDWQMFLRRSGDPVRFSIYHQSFADFLQEKIAPGCKGLDDEFLRSLANAQP